MRQLHCSTLTRGELWTLAQFRHDTEAWLSITRNAPGQALESHICLPHYKIYFFIPFPHEQTTLNWSQQNSKHFLNLQDQRWHLHLKSDYSWPLWCSNKTVLLQNIFNIFRTGISKPFGMKSIAYLTGCQGQENIDFCSPHCQLQPEPNRSCAPVSVFCLF